jgi:hypothetical protein
VTADKPTKATKRPRVLAPLSDFTNRALERVRNVGRSLLAASASLRGQIRRGQVLGFLSGVAVATGLLTLKMADRLAAALRVIPNPALPVRIFVVLVTVLALVWAAPRIKWAIIRWSRRRQWLAFDSALAGGILVSLLSLFVAHDPGFDRDALLLLWCAGVVAGILLVVRWSLPTKVREAGRLALSDSRSATAKKVESILAELELRPQLAVPDDLQGRQDIANSITTILGASRSVGLTIGVNGPLGSGKTTLANEISDRLRVTGALIARFDAWSFRNPDRVVHGYFAAVNDTLRSWASLPGLRTLMARLSHRVAVAARGVRAADLAEALFTSDDSAEDLASDLDKALRALDRSLVVIVDDLDRLDDAELRAAFRAIRLLADRPRISHLLCYDSRRIQQTLFPGTDKTTAADAHLFLEKIISMEFELTTLPLDTRLGLLSKALEPLLTRAENADELRERLGHIDGNAIAGALPTPRRINRVALMVAMEWLIRRDKVDIGDLLVLTVIQYAFPRLYQVMHEQPDLFLRPDWTAHPIALDPTILQEKRDRVLNPLKEGDPDDVQHRLLAMLFPDVFETALGGKVDRAAALADRRMMHPDVYPLYMRMPLGPGRSSPEEMEAYAHMLTSPDLREGVIRERIDAAARSNQWVPFWEMWRQSIESLRHENELTPDLIADFVRTLAKNSGTIPGEPNDPFAQLRFASGEAMRLVSQLPDDASATRAAVDAIRISTNLGFAGDMVFYAVTPERTASMYRLRRPDATQVQEAFDAEVRRRFVDGARTLREASDYELLAVIYRTGDKTLASSALHTAASSDAPFIARLLRQLIFLDSVMERGKWTVGDHHLQGLAQHLNLEVLANEIRQLGLGAWPDAKEKARVQFFLKFVDKI